MNEFKKSLIPENYGNIPQVTPLSEREARRTYEKYVIDQEEQFILFINYLNQYLNHLRDLGKITPFLSFYARVKATSSAYKNHSDGKSLDDVFGIEILATAEEEFRILMEEIESSPEATHLLKVLHVKNHDKENGYKAEHHTCSIEPKLIKTLNALLGKTKGNSISEQLFPLIEFQYKTFGVYYQGNFGTASHEQYKNTEMKQVQALYDSDLLTVGEYIPTMWVSNPYSDNVRELTSRDVLKKMYPSLKLKDIKGTPEQQEGIEVEEQDQNEK